MDSQLNRKRILIFLAITCGVAWAAAVVLRLTVGAHDLMKAGLLSNYLVAIWAPALANVATRLITKEGRGHLMLRPNLRRSWRFYLAAWLLPFLAVTTGAALYYLFFPQSFDSTLGAARIQLAALPPLAAWAPAASSAAVFLALLAWVMIVLAPAYALVSFGEEFGWRAYLLPKLVQQFAGAAADDPAPAGSRYAAAGRKAALLIGGIWGVWHLPAHFLFTPGTAVLPELLFILSTCCLSVLLCWVTLRSGSVWPAAVGHGTANNALAFPIFSLKGPANPLLGPAGGLIGGLGTLILALILLVSRRAFAAQVDAGPQKEPAVAAA